MDSSFAKIPAVVPENEKQYPEPEKMGIMPAYGFFIRHAKNVELNHVDLQLENDDFRPAFILDDVTGASLNDVTMSKVGAVPSVILKNVEDIRIKDCRPLRDKQIKKINSTQL